MECNDSAFVALFSNHLILKIIFRNVQNLSDLCSARRVCRIWERETRPFVEPRALVSIEWETKIFSYKRQQCNPSIAEFMEYVDTVSPQNVLFHHFILLDWNKSAKFQFIFQLFWETCGPLIKSLKIDKLWISPFEEDILPGILYGYTPNMESLDLRFSLKIEVPLTTRSTKYLDDSFFYSFYSKDMTVDPETPRNLNIKSFACDDHGIFHKQINYGQILYSYPSLKKLAVHSRNYATYFKAISEVREAYPECLASLETLHLFHTSFHNSTEENYRMATDLDIPTVTSLHLGLGYGNISYESVYNLLDKWKISLKKLTLSTKTNQNENAWVTFSQFVPLLSINFVNLVYLKIPIYLRPISFDFLQHLPRLELLDVTDNLWNQMCFKSVLENTSEDFCHESLRGIISLPYPFEVPPELRVQTKKMFPNFIIGNKKYLDELKAVAETSS